MYLVFPKPCTRFLVEALEGRVNEDSEQIAAGDIYYTRELTYKRTDVNDLLLSSPLLSHRLLSKAILSAGRVKSPFLVRYAVSTDGNLNPCKSRGVLSASEHYADA